MRFDKVKIIEVIKEEQTKFPEFVKVTFKGEFKGYKNEYQTIFKSDDWNKGVKKGYIMIAGAQFHEIN